MNLHLVVSEYMVRALGGRWATKAWAGSQRKLEAAGKQGATYWWCHHHCWGNGSWAVRASPARGLVSPRWVPRGEPRPWPARLPHWIPVSCSAVAIAADSWARDVVKLRSSELGAEGESRCRPRHPYIACMWGRPGSAWTLDCRAAHHVHRAGLGAWPGCGCPPAFLLGLWHLWSLQQCWLNGPHKPWPSGLMSLPSASIPCVLSRLVAGNWACPVWLHQEKLQESWV